MARTKGPAYKMKSAAHGGPMRRNFPSAFRDEKEDVVKGGTLPEVTVSGGKAGPGDVETDVTEEYKKTGSKETRDAIASGTKVYRSKSGEITMKTPQ